MGKLLQILGKICANSQNVGEILRNRAFWGDIQRIVTTFGEIISEIGEDFGEAIDTVFEISGEAKCSVHICFGSTPARGRAVVATKLALLCVAAG